MPVMQTAPGPVAVIDGREVLYFAGTAYLGLQRRAEVVEALREAARIGGMGPATSRSSTGYGDSPALLRLERAAADFHGCQAAFCVGSGYLGPRVLLGALEQSFDVILIDEAAHGSLADAAGQSARLLVPFRHADPGDLLAKLHDHVLPGRRPMVLTDGVFSATGRIAPLTDYHDALRAYPGSALLVDDAHGLGTLGTEGRGTLEYLGLGARAAVNECPPGMLADGSADGPPTAAGRVYLCGSLAKALGGYGGVIAGSREFVAWLKHVSPVYAGATPLPVPIAAATATAIELARTEPRLRQRLRENAARLKSGLRVLGLPVSMAPTPMAGFSLGGEPLMRRIHAELLRRGVAIAYLSNYAGLSGRGALRMAVSAEHTPAMIDRLLAELAAAVGQLMPSQPLAKQTAESAPAPETFDPSSAG